VRPPRLGLVVARTIGTAVRRNRVKRLCRECFRTWPDLLPDGVDLVVIARTGAPELCLAQVQGEWRTVQPQLRKRAAEALAQTERTHHSGRGR
jgi:ribonuclease P protein component